MYDMRDLRPKLARTWSISLGLTRTVRLGIVESFPILSIVKFHPPHATNLLHTRPNMRPLTSLTPGLNNQCTPRSNSSSISSIGSSPRTRPIRQLRPTGPNTVYSQAISAQSLASGCHGEGAENILNIVQKFR